MELADRIRDLAKRASGHVEHLQTEEATKNALIMPFISALGYDVFNPLEVIPEFTADVGTKKGEKVDYAIMQDGDPIILIECKWSGQNLDEVHASQLYRYFSVTSSRIGILTNGITYRFYSDLEEANKMDSRPFFEIDLRTLADKHIEELKSFAKASFDIDSLLENASDLKYRRGIKRLLAEEWQNPSEDFVRCFSSRVYNGRLTQGAKEQFTALVRSAFQEFVTDRVNDRLRNALAQTAKPEITQDDQEEPHEEVVSDSLSEDGIETTQEEIEGFMIVRAIVSEAVSPSRVYMRDTKSYCGILLDDNNRKPICRLYFDGKTKYIGLFDDDKNVTRVEISSPVDIYTHASSLKATCFALDGVTAPAQEHAAM